MEPDPDRNERQKNMNHTRAEAKKREETSAVLWVGGFSGHSANGQAHTDEHIESQLRETFPELSAWKRTSTGSAILSFDTRANANAVRAKLGETSSFFPYGVRTRRTQGPLPSAHNNEHERRIVAGPRQASLVQPPPAITRPPMAKHAFDYRSCGKSLVPEQDPGRGLTRKEVRTRVQERRGEFFDGNRGARLRGETTAWQAYQAELTRQHGAARRTSVHDVPSTLAAQAPSTGMDKHAARASPENTAAVNPAALAAQPDQTPRDRTSAQAMR
jgi:hypothetical protein